MEFLTGRKGYAHFTAPQFRAFIQSFIGPDSYILGTEDINIAVGSGNIIKVPPLMLVHHGGLFYIPEEEEVTYQNGTQGMKRTDLIVARYTKDSEGLESAALIVLQGTPASSSPELPAYEVGNMQNGDSTDDCPLIKITLNGLDVESVEVLVELLSPLSGKQNQITSGTSEPSGGMSGDVYIQISE